jgi:RNA polymerase sigma-70 factor (ECF subfamily)
VSAPEPLPKGSTRPSADDALHAAVRRARLGSAAAFDELVVLAGPRLYRFLWARLGDDRDARDALQETFVAAWQGLPRLRDLERAWPWLVGIAARKAADVVRRRRAASVTAAVSAAATSGEAVDVRDALARLPQHLREALLLRYVLELSEEEAAVALGVRVGTVKSRAARARQRLLEELA